MTPSVQNLYRAMLIALPLAAAVGSATAALPEPSAQEKAASEEKLAIANREAAEQAKKIEAAMDRVNARYRDRMQAQGKPTLAPVAVAAQKEVKQQMDQRKEFGPPTNHQSTPTTTMPPVKEGHKVESQPGGAPGAR